jgi:hypothetical protein
MASEDSEELVSGLPSVHRLSDFDDLNETVDRFVTIRGDELDTSYELLEVCLLRAAHRMLPKERYHRPEQILTPSHDVPKQMLAMIVVSLVRENLPDAEELTEVVEAVHALRALRHCELVSDLVTELVAGASGAVALSDKADGEAPLSVYEASHPATKLDQPFLLVFRTRHVVTIVNAASDATMSSAGCSGFPAYSQMRTAPLPTRGAAIDSKDALSFRAALP